MSLIKEALDKAQKSSPEDGTSSDRGAEQPGEESTGDAAFPRRQLGSGDSWKLVKFLLWSGLVLGISLLAGFELVYLWSLI